MFLFLLGCVCSFLLVPLLLIMLNHSVSLLSCVFLFFCCFSSFVGCMYFCSCYFSYAPPAYFPSLVFLLWLTYVILVFLSCLLWRVSRLIVVAVVVLVLSPPHSQLLFFFSPPPPRRAHEKENNGKNKYLILFAFWGSFIFAKMSFQIFFLLSLVGFFRPQNMFLFDVLGMCLRE